jgi:ABC-type branched-subunit amino acid transport system substrate-binding protein
LHYNTGSSDPDISSIEPEAGAVVVFGSYDAANPLLEKLRKTHPDIQVFGSLAMTFDGEIGSAYSGGCEGGIFIASKFCYTTPGQEFKKKYIERYEHMPSPAASFAFDGANLIIEAVRRVGPDREGIRDVLREIKYDSGATGPIEFDPSGNRIAPVFFIRMIKGHPVIFNP